MTGAEREWHIASECRRSLEAFLRIPVQRTFDRLMQDLAQFQPAFLATRGIKPATSSADTSNA